jgi:uncharacterized membrane protein
MKLARGLLLFHIFAVSMALFSMLVLIPYPHLWQGLPGSNHAFAWAMEHAGPLHIVAGAAAMLAVGHATLGPRATWTYFAVAVPLSLSMELLGTGTGWPFGNYGYTEGLGTKLFGRVPWSIPLSWYYLSFASYLVARHVLARLRPQGAPFAATVVLSTWLLTAWDLVLDPAMAHPDRHLSFWVWHERGAYLGMPLVNLAGWMVTGALILVVTRLLLGAEPDAARVPPLYPYAIYVTNLLFGVVLCASVGLWGAIALAFVAGIGPASLVWRRG